MQAPIRTRLVISGLKVPKEKIAAVSGPECIRVFLGVRSMMIILLGIAAAAFALGACLPANHDIKVIR
jgi:hypothetical protein